MSILTLYSRVPNTPLASKSSKQNILNLSNSYISYLNHLNTMKKPIKRQLNSTNLILIIQEPSRKQINV